MGIPGKDFMSSMGNRGPSGSLGCFLFEDVYKAIGVLRVSPLEVKLIFRHYSYIEKVRQYLSYHNFLWKKIFFIFLPSTCQNV